MPSALEGGDHQVGRAELPLQARELMGILFPHLAGLDLGRVADAGEVVVAFASVRGAQARCTGCGQASSRVHSRYQRLVADGAAGGRPLLIALSVRRFRCMSPACPRTTFVEQAEGLTGATCGGPCRCWSYWPASGWSWPAAGARLAAVLGISVHSSTLLRLVMSLPDPEVTAAPQVTGVDDFALRKGQVYGTVVADAESGKVIDLLPAAAATRALPSPAPSERGPAAGRPARPGSGAPR
jgi:hypothetical protein